MKKNYSVLVCAALCALLLGCPQGDIIKPQEAPVPKAIAPEGVVVTARTVRVTYYMDINDIPQKNGKYQWQVVIEKTQERFSNWLASDWPDKESVDVFRKYMKDNNLAVIDLKCSYIWSVTHMTATIRLCLDEPADTQKVSEEQLYFEVEL